MDPHPIRLVVEDDLRRSRLTVFFRLLLAIPHLVWITLWSVAVLLAAIVGWFATLVTGRLPGGLHRFAAAYVRYSTHLNAYLYLAANPYPGFVGAAGGYPVDLEIGPPERQSRWKTGFRLVLAVPAILVALTIGGTGGGTGGGAPQGGSGDDAASFAVGTVSVLLTVAILGWFASLVRGRMPQGFRDLAAYGLRYGAQTLGFLLLLTDRYPNSDPVEPPATQPTPEKPVRLRVDDGLARSRLTVFFRLLLALPHLVWLTLWGVAVLLAAVVGWFATLATGALPTPLHRFLSAFLRYWTHVTAFLYLVANPFPGFTGDPGSYPVEVELPARERQSRLKTAFRVLLALPALAVASALSGALAVAAVLGWFVGVFLARMPEGLRNLAAFVLRYSAQTYAYVLLLTDSYPYSGPSAFAEPEPEPEDAPAWPAAPSSAPS